MSVSETPPAASWQWQKIGVAGACIAAPQCQMLKGKGHKRKGRPAAPELRAPSSWGLWEIMRDGGGGTAGKLHAPPAGCVCGPVCPSQSCSWSHFCHVSLRYTSGPFKILVQLQRAHAEAFPCVRGWMHGRPVPPLSLVAGWSVRNDWVKTASTWPDAHLGLMFTDHLCQRALIDSKTSTISTCTLPSWPRPSRPVKKRSHPSHKVPQGSKVL